MQFAGVLVVLERVTPELAARIITRAETPADRSHPEYPLPDELDPLGSLAAAPAPAPFFTMYSIRRVTDDAAFGGIGFFGPPDEAGRVELGYGLVPAARGAGLASEAVALLLTAAPGFGARTVAADTDVDNTASRRVLTKNGFRQTGRQGSLILYLRTLEDVERR